MTCSSRPARQRQRGAVPVALTLNGLQFTPELLEFVYQHESADEAEWHGPPPGTAAAR